MYERHDNVSNVISIGQIHVVAVTTDSVSRITKQRELNQAIYKRVYSEISKL